MRFLFFSAPMLLLQYRFMASLLAMATVINNLTTDQSALLAFKADVIDSRSVLANNWSISYPICNWVGISCGARHHRVVALNLSSFSLGGIIPPHLGNLSFLVSLDISENNFYGHLPNELGKLRRLRLINFAYNELSGSFPSWIGILSRLQILSFHNNSFTDRIPDFLLNLSKLEFLDLMENSLSGSLPNDMCSRLPKLEKLYLGSNDFFGQIPSSLSECTHLQTLWLADNKLIGPLPESIGNLSKLTLLNLAHNNLQDPIPRSFYDISSLTKIDLGFNSLSGSLPNDMCSRLPKLEKLYLGSNDFFGQIPSSLSECTHLQTLWLADNKFSGRLPENIGNLSQLTDLNLAQNNLQDQWSFLSSLTNCRSLTELALNVNPLRGILPPFIGNFSASLRKFEAIKCELKGSIPQEIGNLSGLMFLKLDDNELNGTIPTTVGRFQQLQGLSLYDNDLQGSIPYYLCHLERLSQLLLNGNNLSGAIPACLGSLTSLRELHLGSNTLTYSIPSSLWSLEYILYVNLSSNSLSGPLPSSIQNLKVLINLDLSRNQLSGDNPITISGLKDLATLSLAGNQFNGPIPESFGSLISLESLDVSSNNISGKIPKSLEALLYLKKLNVSYNRLEGEIPIKGPFRNFSAQSFSGNYALCGPPRLQVPPCKEDKGKGSKKAPFALKFILPLIISIVLIAIVSVFFIRRQNGNTKVPVKEDVLSLATWRRTSYLDIQRATDGFNECNLLGRGSFGLVYKGTLFDGTNVAIKVFNLQLERAFRTFDSECEILRNVRHRNLVKIFSSCCNIDFKALVLEFMPNGSFEKWLYSYNYFLDILQRLNIMIDVALALEYLNHGHSLAPIVHCDLKPNNILLDENKTAHVSDFGISKLLGEGDDSVTQTITTATIGYMAPEYGSEGIVSAKCDVYSYGVLLMETFTRKKPTDEMFTGEMSLRRWVKESLPHGLTEVVDANLVGEEQAFSAKTDCLLSIMDLALDCCMESPEQRIHMTDTAAELKKIRVKFLQQSSVAGTN
ncbi:probable LRR receptor-like serine/threonine-protein kinase At3g47570 isoform X3 [Citrus sinensis]|uniref:probable LRR receptor-like serine/threonine-protein kinase At3g47570 isoform X3 n=1 Tax=Citrus sinensis TaxID=2711 RepID=UPI0022787541|nr:probable LRR receptor-like serine/threonine-protein kinase At3g47570 isoform X3 [Citrus sinensis]